MRSPVKVHVHAGTYDHREAQLVLITNQGRKISISTRAVLGGFFGGTRRNVSTTLRIRANEALTTELDWSHNDVRLPGGDFVINLVQTRISYSFTPRLYVQGLFQYSNSIGDLWSANLRLGWLQTANTGLFVVLNDVSESSQPFHNSLGRTITVKYSRLLNVLR